MLLRGASTTYCTPRPSACSCSSLIETELKKHPSVNTIRGVFSANPPLAGCKCYLGAAARAGFTSVTLESKKEACQGTKQINKNNYRDICEAYAKHNCASKDDEVWGEITNLK